MNDESVGDQFLDERDVEQVGRRAIGPAHRTLFAGDGVHQDAKEIPGIAAVVKNLGLNFFSREAAAIEQLTVQPMVEERPAVFAPGEVAEAKAQQIKSIALRVINSEAAGRE